MQCQGKLEVRFLLNNEVCLKSLLNKNSNMSDLVPASNGHTRSELDRIRIYWEMRFSVLKFWCCCNFETRWSSMKETWKGKTQSVLPPWCTLTFGLKKHRRFRAHGQTLVDPYFSDASPMRAEQLSLNLLGQCRIESDLSVCIVLVWSSVEGAGAKSLKWSVECGDVYHWWRLSSRSDSWAVDKVATGSGATDKEWTCPRQRNSRVDCDKCSCGQTKALSVCTVYSGLEGLTMQLGCC